MWDKRRTLKISAFVFIAVIVLEIVCFNFAHWESLTFDKNLSYETTIEGDHILISGIRGRVKNLVVKADNGYKTKPVNISISFSDHANTDLELSPTEVIGFLPESSYIRLGPDGNISSMKITFTDDDFTPTADNCSIEFNKERPFSFHIGRVLLLTLTVLFIAALLPSSQIYKIRLLEEMPTLPSKDTDPAAKRGLSRDLNIRRKYRYTPLIIVISCAACLLWISIVSLFSANGLYYIMDCFKNNQVEAIFSLQADALLDGHAYLKATPPAFMSEMDNPYNRAERVRLVKETGETFCLDFAFFEGRYYSYFGIIPTLIFYLPFLAITGIPAKNSFFIVAMSVIFIFTLSQTVFDLCKKICKDCSLGHYILMFLTVLFGSIFIYVARTPYIYSVAFSSALAFTSAGISFWLRGKDKGLSKIRLILGSVCMGLAIGCRPTFGVFILLAFPIFREEIKERLFFSKRGLANTLAVILPVFFIGLGLLYFNYIRFGNPLDFGSTYNLTGTDYVHREFKTGFLAFGIFEYLFQPVNISGTFPYISSLYGWGNEPVDFMGYIFIDPLLGGLFTTAPVLLLSFLVFKRRESLKRHDLFYFCITALALAALLLFTDLEMAGITLRYQLDFAYPVALCTAVIICDILNDPAVKSEKKLHKLVGDIIIALVIFTVLFNLFSLINNSQPYSLNTSDPSSYYSAKYLIFTPR